jgi:hypothetical protein
MAEFLASMVEGETFACPSHKGRKAGNYSVVGASNHITWCGDMQGYYEVVATKAKGKAAKRKPTQIEDSALRGPASKASTVRRDRKQVEKPVARQSNTVRSAGRVRVTGGYVDPATITVSDWNLDKNGREIKGKALSNRVAKLVRDGKAVVVAKESKTPVREESKIPAKSELADIHTRLLVVEQAVKAFENVQQALGAFAAAQEDMIANPAS